MAEVLARLKKHVTTPRLRVLVQFAFSWRPTVPASSSASMYPYPCDIARRCGQGDVRVLTSEVSANEPDAEMRASSVEEVRQFAERLVREGQELRAEGASRRRLESNRRELIRAHRALSAALIAPYCGSEAA
jgi:hypothetical protein